MHPTEVFDRDETAPSGADEQRRVIVELDSSGSARVRQAPPDVLVMFVESREITASGNRSIAAGSRGRMLTSGDLAATETRTQPREIAVAFPG